MALVGCEPVTCQKVTEWTDPAVCSEIGQTMNACWHDIQVPIPNVCNNIVVNECYPEEVQINAGQYVGYFSGQITLTFGATMAASVSGSYQDVFGTYASWSAGGSIETTANGRELCLDVPSDALPGGALVYAFSPNGQARFCSAL